MSQTTTPNSDGIKASPDLEQAPQGFKLPQSLLAEVEVLTAESREMVSPQAEPVPMQQGQEGVATADNLGEKSPDKDVLVALGLTKRMAMRMLANGRPDAFLNTKVTARVLLVNQANSIEQIQIAQRLANQKAKKKDCDQRVRASLLAVVAQCGMALARISEVALTTARNLDAPETADAPKVPLQQNNYFTFPPVAAKPKTALAASATSGSE